MAARASAPGSLVILVSLVAFAPAARAEVPPGDDVRARADVEFEEAKALMDAGQIVAACARFAHSYELDPKLGRLLNLAYCHEAEGKTASAWREYNDAAALAGRKGQKERVDFAREHAAVVAKRLAFLHLVIPPGVEAVEVDGAALPPDQWSTPLPVDPGDHSVVARAARMRPHTMTVGVGRSAGVQEVVVAALERDTPAGPAAAPPAAVPAEDRTSRRGPADGGRPDARGGSLLPAFIAAGLGAAGLGVGAGFGLVAASKKGQADPHCPGKVCDPVGSAFIADARSAATGATVGLGVAVAAAGAATWLFLSPPGGGASAATVSPILTTVGSGLRLEGTW